MLRKIPVHQARVGMYVHEVCGSWLAHAFWRSSFLIRDERQIGQLAAVAEIVIDTDRGLDVLADAPGAAPYLDDIEVPQTSEMPPGHAPDDPLSGALPVSPAASTLQQELNHARRIVQHAREAMVSLYADARLGRAVDARHCLPMVEDITQSVARNPHALVSLSRLKTSDDYTYMHSVAVCALMVSLARQLGLDDEATRLAGLGGLVHDIGKAQMPLAVLNKPGALTPEEFAIMKGHPEAGHRMLQDGQGAGDVPLDVCLHHHEKINGQGYPHGLKGEQISPFARMGAVCDVYDAITSNRPYKAGWDPAQSVQRMAQWAKDGHFDERIFQAFVKSIGIYPTGSLVKLKSGLIGVVVEQGSASLLAPSVRVFHSSTSNAPIVPRLLDLAGAASDEQIISRESPEAWGFVDTDRFWVQPQG
ncbi:MAG: HD-GYP domain-containing protein [Aquabacterium sp.]